MQVSRLLHQSRQQLTARFCAPFSTYFRELDKASREKMMWEYYKVPEYAKMDRMWRVPLAKKEARKARKAEAEKAREPVVAQDEILYVHNAEFGVTLPPLPNEMFAVFRLMNR